MCALFYMVGFVAGGIVLWVYGVLHFVFALGCVFGCLGGAGFFGRL